MKDNFGKDWTIEENDLDKFCKTHRLTHIVEYDINTLDGSHLKAPHLDEGDIFCYTAIIQEGTTNTSSKLNIN